MGCLVSNTPIAITTEGKVKNLAVCWGMTIRRTTTNHHKPPQTITNHHKPPQTITNHHKPPQTITNHHKPSQTTTNHHKPPQTITNHHKSPQATANYLKPPPEFGTISGENDEKQANHRKPLQTTTRILVKKKCNCQFCGLNLAKARRNIYI